MLWPYRLAHIHSRWWDCSCQTASLWKLLNCQLLLIFRSRQSQRQSSWIERLASHRSLWASLMKLMLLVHRCKELDTLLKRLLADL